MHTQCKAWSPQRRSYIPKSLDASCLGKQKLRLKASHEDWMGATKTSDPKRVQRIRYSDRKVCTESKRKLENWAQYVVSVKLKPFQILVMMVFIVFVHHRSLVSSSGSLNVPPSACCIEESTRTRDSNCFVNLETEYICNWKRVVISKFWPTGWTIREPNQTPRKRPCSCQHDDPTLIRIGHFGREIWTIKCQILQCHIHRHFSNLKLGLVAPWLTWLWNRFLV